MTETQEPAKLTTLTNVEKIVNEYAKKFASKYRIRDDQFRVILTRDLDGILGISRGPVVNIYLLWPDAQPNINTLLRDAFKQIQTRKLIDSLNIEPMSHIRARNIERRQWLKKNVADEADIIGDLIPRHRMRVTRSVTTTIEDTLTGLTVTNTIEEKNLRFDGREVREWMQLSRMVLERLERELAEEQAREREEIAELNEVVNE